MAEENQRDRVKSQFSSVADAYKRSRIHSNEEDLEYIVKFVNPEQNYKVLDIATGAGHCAIAFSYHVKSVIASDLTPRMLEQAKELIHEKNISNISTCQLDVHEIPFENKTFDLVTIRIAAHHFEDVQQAMKEVHRVLKTGGKLFIEDTKAPEDSSAANWFNKLEELRDRSHVRDLNEEEWIILLESIGFTVDNITTQEKDWPLLWWTKRMNTPRENVERILHMIRMEYHEYKNEIKILPDKNNYYIIYPHNIYILAKTVSD